MDIQKVAPRLCVVVTTLLAACGLATAATGQGFDWYGRPQTKVFLTYCKPGLGNERSLAFRYCDTIWNTFKEGYFSGLNVSNQTCFIDRAQLSDLVRYIEEKGEEYINETGWLFAMRDFLAQRLEACRADRFRDDQR